MFPTKEHIFIIATGLLNYLFHNKHFFDTITPRIETVSHRERTCSFKQEKRLSSLLLTIAIVSFQSQQQEEEDSTNWIKNPL